MYRESTHRITVTAMPVFIDERSDPEKGHYFWAYRIQIVNNNPEKAQLISRYWHITDANGVSEEVYGDGVVGEQPQLSPGETFEYTSGCPLSTPSGIMTGHFIVINEQGEELKIKIPAFSLDLPDVEPIYN